LDQQANTVGAFDRLLEGILEFVLEEVPAYPVEKLAGQITESKQ